VPACREGAPNADKVHLCRDAADRMALPDTDFFKRICAENEKDVPVLTENLVSDCFGIDECKEIAKAARSKKLLGLKLSTRSLRYLPSIGLETILPTFEESTVENLAILLDRPVRGLLQSIYAVPVLSATLPVPANLEAIIRSRQTNDSRTSPSPITELSESCPPPMKPIRRLET
jgi:hypothetical protein